jgi:hypothetical protein
MINFICGTAGGNRTPNRQIWNLQLYQLSYRRTDSDNIEIDYKLQQSSGLN